MDQELIALQLTQRLEYELTQYNKQMGCMYIILALVCVIGLFVIGIRR
jgi:hypothetical protein